MYTAVYGGYDRLVRPVEQDVPVRYVCFTDDPALKGDPWEVRVAEPRYSSPRMSVNWHKARPHETLGGSGLTIWVDANLAIDSPHFVRQAVEHVGEAGVAVFQHPQRSCVYDEAFVIMRLGKAPPDIVLAQVRSYLEEGHPRRAGLFAGGVIARDSSRPKIRDLGDVWLEETQRWSVRDQLSLAVVLRRLRIRPAVFPYHLHRHSFRGAYACYLHRYAWFARAAWRLDAHATGRPPVVARPLLDGRQRAPGRGAAGPWSPNPWFVITDHQGPT